MNIAFRSRKAPAFENREDRGSLSWNGSGKGWASPPTLES
jgi:hypothetical protein